MRVSWCPAGGNLRVAFPAGTARTRPDDRTPAGIRDEPRLSRLAARTKGRILFRFAGFPVAPVTLGPRQGLACFGHFLQLDNC